MTKEDSSTSRRSRIDLAALRERLHDTRGPRFWRSLDELAETEEFQELLHREFPELGVELPGGVSRRRFMQLMSASLALGGLTACTRQPLEKIVPYVEQPETLVPGRPLYFATSMTLDGVASGLLAESHMGRPTKVEGNPEHPASLGATDLLAQASVLSLYDPDRSQVVTNLDRIRSWSAFVDDTRLETLASARLRLLTGTITSPSLAALIQQVLSKYPQARWHQYDAVTRDNVLAGAEMAFGEVVATRYDFARADVVVALDADFLTSGPGAVRYARDFMSRRRAPAGHLEMNRLYAVESMPTATGTVADHRLPLRPSGLARFAAALAAVIGVPGATAPAGSDVGSQGEWLRAVARDLQAHRGSSVVVPGDYASAEVHALAHAINSHLGNVGRTVIHTLPLAAAPEDQTGSLASLVDEMTAGEVDILVMLDCNPVYNAPVDLDFTSALRQVGRRIHLGLYQNETSEHCHWHVPAAHYLESWGDARAYDGTISLVQPLIEPLYDGKTVAEVLSVFTEEGSRPAHDLVRSHWQGALGEADFESRWRQALHDGFIADSALPAKEVALRTAATAEATARIAEANQITDGVDLAFRPDPTIYDGRFNNNGWLQECPKPLTKLTWDNAALVSPALALEMGLENTQMVEVTVDDRMLEVPVWILPGHADGCMTIHLGYGRTRTGRVGSGSGFDAYRLRSSQAPWAVTGARIRKTERRYKLASTQLHSNIGLAPGPGEEPGFGVEGVEAKRRHLIRVGTLEHYRQEPDFAQHLGHAPPEGLSMYPPWEYPGYAWGLSIDLGACTGCNACVVACQSENNTPIVGKDMVAMGREMNWIRIDRYFEGELEQPDIHVHHQPVMCMHCEQAPCEVVCPVGATVHSSEGLNDMVYNRCVGTRYCSNNCPYKVRRFNFFKYNDTETPVLKLLRNPDVTVRTRGVMEKCTYCVQRINHARIEAEKEARQIRDGEILTACQQVCPTEAIIFGDINDPESKVSRAKAE
ncbi:MAG: TAT-variant-translocated molybdopterin oxidoreductase, partial [Thermoanaerobaculia bacterium]